MKLARGLFHDFSKFCNDVVFLNAQTISLNQHVQVNDKL